MLRPLGTSPFQSGFGRVWQSQLDFFATSGLAEAELVLAIILQDHVVFSHRIIQIILCGSNFLQPQTSEFNFHILKGSALLNARFCKIFLHRPVIVWSYLNPSLYFITSIFYRRFSKFYFILKLNNFSSNVALCWCQCLEANGPTNTSTPASLCWQDRPKPAHASMWEADGWMQIFSNRTETATDSWTVFELIY